MTAFTSATAFVKRWHAMVEARDLSALDEMAHENAVFFSPAVFKPYEGREALKFILSTVITVFEDFTYHREFYTEDARSIALEFTARVGDKSLQGADYIKFDKDGKIIEFTVMVRPMSGLMNLADAMRARFEAATHAPQ
ncbi:MAG: nuclear transport factor 2 family protein [Pseudomonadota bacterium]